MPGPAHDSGEENGAGHQCADGNEEAPPPLLPPHPSARLEQQKERLLVRLLPRWRSRLRRRRRLWGLLAPHSAAVMSLTMTRRLTSSLTEALARGPMPFEPTMRAPSTPFAASQRLTASTRRWLSRRL